MRKRIHTILALTMAAMLWAGCEDTNAPDNSGRAISFACNTEKTRAQVITDGNMASFRVSAVWAKKDGTFMTNFMDGQFVEKNENNKWVYSPICYMPNDGSTVDFFAYSPANASVSDFTIYESPSYDQTVSFDYDVTTDPLAQHDLTVAEALNQESNSILLGFQHVLSSVQVKICSGRTGHSFRIREVKLINLCRKGTFNTSNWSWELPDENNIERATYPIAQTSPIVVDGSYTLISNELLMVLPQTVKTKDATINDPSDLSFIGTDFYVFITYDTLKDTDLTKPIERNIATYIPVSDSGTGNDKQFTFVQGKNYTLNIELK